MDFYQREIERLLKEHGATERKGGKHRVFKFPNGQVYVLARTPSDVRAGANALSDLRHSLGLVGGGDGAADKAPRRSQKDASREKAEEIAKLRESWRVEQVKKEQAPEPTKFIQPPMPEAHEYRYTVSRLGGLAQTSKRRYRKQYEKRAGEVKVYSREAIAQYNQIARYSESEAKRFLGSLSSGDGQSCSESMHQATTMGGKTEMSRTANTPFTAQIAETNAAISRLENYKQMLLASETEYFTVSGLLTGTTVTTTTTTKAKRGRANTTKGSVKTAVETALNSIGRGATLDELAHATGFAKTKLQTNMYNYVNKGILVRDDMRKTYWFGPKFTGTVKGGVAGFTGTVNHVTA